MKTGRNLMVRINLKIKGRSHNFRRRPFYLQLSAFLKHPISKVPFTLLLLLFLKEL